jgi:hypothetical protein
LFHVLFDESSGQAQKIQKIWVAEDEIGRHPVLVSQGGDVGRDQVVGLFADGCPLEEEMADLMSQRAGAPSLDAADLRVEIAFQRIVDREQLPEMGPR